MRSNTRLCTVSWKGVEEGGVDIYEGMPFVYIRGGNKGFRQGWMVRGEKFAPLFPVEPKRHL